MSLQAAYIVPHPPLAVPEVGQGEEAAISTTLAAYKQVAQRIATHRPSTIVFISPHSAYYKDWIYLGSGREAQGNLREYGAPSVSFTVRYDTAFCDALISAAGNQNIPAGYTSKQSQDLDHGIMVPLAFINAELDAKLYRAVSIGGSGLPSPDLIEFGRCIARVAEAQEASVVLVASGDLSHRLKEGGPYGFNAAGPLFDERFGEIIRSGNLLNFAAIDEQMREDAAECGLSGFIMLAGVLDEITTTKGELFTSELLSLEGPFGVGYGVAAFEKEAKPASTKSSSGEPSSVSAAPSPLSSISPSTDPLVQLAAQTIETYVSLHKRPVPPSLPANLPDKAGCFVTIHEASTGDLRGCIGTTEPREPTLAEEVIENAISAATRDPRFPPLDSSELNDIAVSVDVLFPPEPATLDGLDPKKYGVIVSKGFKRGLLLPDLEGVDTIEEQLRIACRKAGIDPRSSFTIERFEVERHT